MRRHWLLATCALVMVLAGASYVRADGPPLQTLELGTGPTIVMVPGLGLGRTDWLPTVKHLRERYHCVMVEIPGQGASPLPDPFSLQAAAAALDDVLARQKAESTVVVGSGVGGVLALLAASAHPEHVRGVVLVDAAIKSPLPIADQDRDRVVKFIDENFAAFAQMTFTHMGRDSVESARLYALMSAVPVATLKAYYRQLIALDANREFRSLAVPSALLFSERRWPAGASPGSVLRASGHDDTLHVATTRIAGAGVLVMKDQPDTLATLLDGFARRSFAGHVLSAND